MQIIVVSGDFRTKKSLNVGFPQVVGLTFVALLALGLTATLANYLSLKYAATSNHPLIRSVLLADQHAEAKERQQQIQDNINNLAVKLGEVQAHMLRLDGLGEKLAKVAGLKPAELPSATANSGRGGAATVGAPLSIEDFAKQLSELNKATDVKADQLSVLEALLVEGSAQRKFLPTLVTRYAHASELFVKEGDLVVRGQRIARVGTTGRSTGPHLHFEVRLNGVAQNPGRFLAVQ